MRTWLAMVPKARVVAGRIMCCKLPTPIAGSQFSLRQNTS